MFVYELSGSGSESSCSDLNFRFRPASSKELLDIQATIECGFTLKRVRDIIRIYSQMHRTDKHSKQFSRLASLAKWLSVCLWTKWFWVQAQLQSLNFKTASTNDHTMPTSLTVNLTFSKFKEFWVFHLTCIWWTSPEWAMP